MSAKIIDGKAISQQIKDELKEKTAALKEKGIEVAEETCYAKNKPNEKQMAEAEAFAKKMISC